MKYLSAAEAEEIREQDRLVALTPHKDWCQIDKRLGLSDSCCPCFDARWEEVGARMWPDN